MTYPDKVLHELSDYIIEPKLAKSPKVMQKAKNYIRDLDETLKRRYPGG